MKDELRREMKLKRRTLTKEEIARCSAEIARKLFLQNQTKDAKSVMVYVSAFNEVATDGIIRELFRMKKLVAVPVSDTATETITVSYIDSTEDFSKGAYGIREPKKIHKAELADIDVIIIPALAFDLKLNRMGFGQGYYDKLLADFSGCKIGLCYDFQITDSVFPEPHDIPMDIIITEKRIIYAF